MATVHKIKRKGRAMTKWFNMVPNLADHENLFEEYGGLVCALIVARDDLLRGRKTSVSLKEIGERYGVKNDKKVAEILHEVLGVKFEGRGRQTKTVRDTQGWYEGMESKSFPIKPRQSPDKTPIKIVDLQGFQSDSSRQSPDKTPIKPRQSSITHTERLNTRKQKTESPPTPSKEIPDAVLERAQEFASIYPASGWKGTPKKRGDALVRKCAKRMMSKNFTGLMAWDEFLAATKAYAKEAEATEKGFVFAPWNFLWKDRTKGEFAEPDRDFETWKEFLPMDAGLPTPKEALKAFCESLLAEGAKQPGVERIRTGEPSWGMAGELILDLDAKPHNNCQRALEKYPEALKRTAEALGMDAIVVTPRLSGEWK